MCNIIFKIKKIIYWIIKIGFIMFVFRYIDKGFPIQFNIERILDY